MRSFDMNKKSTYTHKGVGTLLLENNEHETFKHKRT